MKRRKKNLFELKQQVILENLYGVDVKEWAVMVGELRLWLSLIIETDEKYMNIYNRPLLPSFTFKLRQGDSLVEEIGGKQLSLRGEFRYILQPIKDRIEEIRSRKAEYFTSARHEWEQEIEGLEHGLLRDILKDDIRRLGARIKAKEAEKSLAKRQRHMFKTKEEVAESYRQKDRELEYEIESLKREKERLEEVLTDIGKKKDYFFWEIDFAEVFAEKGGFDIVIGNPPYVRQEQIAFPLEKEEEYEAEAWKERKKEYKDKLISSAKLLWGDAIKIDKKSDLYVYFYYHGLSLLKPKGTFCFINSNSWLDVGYGAGLQEFCLKRLEPFYVIDNIAKRSFESDVNTVIVLIKRPSDAPKEGPLKFIAFKKPFEEVVKAETILEIENSKERTANDNFRISPKDRKGLLIEGIEMPEEGEEEKRLIEKDPMEMPYSGNKWGGKYLRAPDIYFTILEKGRVGAGFKPAPTLIRLGDIAEVRFGIKTGANEFFYLNEESLREWKSEKEYLKPVIKSPRECKSILIKPEDLKFKVFMCHKDKKDLKGTNALKYIEWGEKQGFHKRPSCSGRRRWWEIDSSNIGNLIWMKLPRQRLVCFYSLETIGADCNLYYIKTSYFHDLAPILNSCLTFFLAEEFGQNIGGGGGIRPIMVNEVEDLLCFDVSKYLTRNQKEQLQKAFEKLSKRDLLPIFTELGINPAHPIREQEPNPLSDRKALDDIVFDILGLTPEERNEVYWAVCELVKNRLEKARSA